jgi:hypothetical protein
MNISKYLKNGCPCYYHGPTLFSTITKNIFKGDQNRFLVFWDTLLNLKWQYPYNQMVITNNIIGKNHRKKVSTLKKYWFSRETKFAFWDTLFTLKWYYLYNSVFFFINSLPQRHVHVVNDMIWLFFTKIIVTSLQIGHFRPDFYHVRGYILPSFRRQHEISPNSEAN